MKKKICIYSIVFILVFICNIYLTFANPLEENEEYSDYPAEGYLLVEEKRYVGNEVLKEVDYEYNNLGKIISKTTYVGNIIDQVITYTYGASGNLFMEDCIDKITRAGYIKTYYYDYYDRNLLITEDTKGWDYFVSYTINYKYDESKNMIYEEYNDGTAGDIHTYQYDDLGRLIHHEMQDTGVGKTYYIEYYYNDNGLYLETWTDNTGIEVRRFEYIYDNSRLITCYCYDNGEFTREFRYNAAGNLTDYFILPTSEHRVYTYIKNPYISPSPTPTPIPTQMPEKKSHKHVGSISRRLKEAEESLGISNSESKRTRERIEALEDKLGITSKNKDIAERLEQIEEKISGSTSESTTNEENSEEETLNTNGL